MFFGGNQLISRTCRIVPPGEKKKKSTVAIQSAFIGESAYSRKNTSADSSACTSLTCESRAYSVILWQKGSAQQGMVVYLTAFHYTLLHQPRSFYYSVTADYQWLGGITVPEVYFCIGYLHLAHSLNILPLYFTAQKLRGEVYSLDSGNKR